jgi:hypothetical protein
VTEPRGDRVSSTVRVGIRNSSGAALSNCKVYIDQVAPEPPIPGGFPILLNSEPFLVRHDDPERRIDIAYQWNHVDTFKFAAPISGNFSDALMYIPSQPPRTIVIKVKASECQRSATFRLMVDSEKVIHLEFVRYID